MLNKPVRKNSEMKSCSVTGKKKTGTYILYLISYILLLSSNTNAQIVFNRAYDNDSTYDFGRAVLQTLDGGYMLGGYSDVLLEDMYLFRTDFKGDILWSKGYNFTTGYADILSSIIQLSDSTYVICGTTQDTQAIKQDIMLFKTDKNGDSLWLKRYGGAEGDFGQDVEQTADGGFIIAANTYSFSNGNMDAMLIKTDSDGNEEWKKNYGGVGYDNIAKVLITEDDGFLFVGGSGTYSPQGLWLLKTNSMGDSLWQKTYGTIPFAESVESMLKAKNGGYILAGYLSDGSKNKAYMAKVDSACNMEWDKAVIDSNVSYSSMFYGVAQTRDTNFVGAGHGYNSPQPDNLEGLLMKVDNNRDSVWLRFYSHYGSTTQEYIYDMKPTNDGGFIMCGDAFGAGIFKQDMWLVKTDCMGNETFWDSVNCPLGVGIENQFTIHNVQCTISPNPFSESAVIQYYVPETAMDAQIIIYDVTGRVMKTYKLSKGNGQVMINATDMVNGVYIYSLLVDGKRIANNRMVVIK